MFERFLSPKTSCNSATETQNLHAARQDAIRKRRELFRLHGTVQGTNKISVNINVSC